MVEEGLTEKGKIGERTDKKAKGDRSEGKLGESEREVLYCTLFLQR